MIDKARALAGRIAWGRPPSGEAPAGLNELTLARIDGTPLQPAELAGRVVLFVNVASRCGLTPQYADLVALQRTYGAQGFTVVGVPCNQFLGQEPGSPDEIASFCAVRYGVDFPLLEKQDVNGVARSPLYQWLVGDGADVSWNFEKFLVGRNGSVIARFKPKTAPDAPEVVAAVEAALAEPA